MIINPAEYRYIESLPLEFSSLESITTTNEKLKPDTIKSFLQNFFGGQVFTIINTPTITLPQDCSGQENLLNILTHTLNGICIPVTANEIKDGTIILITNLYKLKTALVLDTLKSIGEGQELIKEQIKKVPRINFIQRLEELPLDGGTEITLTYPKGKN